VIFHSRNVVGHFHALQFQRPQQNKYAVRAIADIGNPRISHRPLFEIAIFGRSVVSIYELLGFISNLYTLDIMLHMYDMYTDMFRIDMFIS